MLMSDTWQPAVLQLLPFSPNNASLPHHHPLTPTSHHPAPSSASPISPRPRSFPVTTGGAASATSAAAAADGGGRGFPVLAVTRKEKKETGSGSRGESSGPSGSGGGKGWGGSWNSPSSSAAPSARARLLSERLTRSQTLMDGGGGPGNGATSLSDRTVGHLRVRSEYVMSSGRRSAGVSAGNGGNIISNGNNGSISSRAKSSGPQLRQQATCSVTDMNERVIPLVGFSAENLSPDSGAGGSLRNSPYMMSATSETGSPHGNGGGGGGGSSRGFPKPAFPANALTPSNTTAAGVIGNGSSGVGEGRFVVSRNGMYRSVTLTPGEMELKKHRDLLERVSTVPPAAATGKGDSKEDPKLGQQYHKMNIKDLPRSTTPVNDHDPDKLNMKQVIAFLQSKGKSQADAVELPRGPKTKPNQSVTLPRALKSGVFRGSSVRRPTTSSTSTEILMRSAVARSHPVRDSRDPSPSAGPGQREREAGSGGDIITRSSSSSLPRSHTTMSMKASARDGKEQRRDISRERTTLEKDEGRRSSAHKLQKKPFRLHRFLTMVPTAREPVALSSSTSFDSAAATCPLYSPVPLMPPSSKHAHKERTLCLDLAQQSRTQTTPSRGTEGKQQQAKVHYRLTARPRPSSLRVEQDLSEAQWKLSADFEERDPADRVMTIADSSDNAANARDAKNVIRLPFVLVDSEDEDAGFRSESRKSAKSQKRTHRTKTPGRNSDEKQTVKDEFPSETECEDSLWPTHVNEIQELHSSSQICTTDVVKEEQGLHFSQMSTTSSMLPAPTESLSSFPTVPPSDIVSDNVRTVEEPVDKLPDLDPEGGLIQSTEDKDVKDIDRSSSTSKKVRVSVPNHSDPAKDNANKQKLPDCVTLSLRKERHRTRENTYMSEIGGSDVFSDDTCAARANSESMKMSFRSDDVTSLAS